MIVFIKALVFLLATLGILWVSRASLRDPRSHGFPRFFAWESLLLLFLIAVDRWFDDPFSPRQLVSWAFLILSLALIYQGVQAFRRQGQIDARRADAALVGIEKTTRLVTSGVYHAIRHPFYSSLLFLCWGMLLKNVGWAGVILALLATALLVVTARNEERENLGYFGEEYRAYMGKTKMFIPYIF